MLSIAVTYVPICLSSKTHSGFKHVKTTTVIQLRHLNRILMCIFQRLSDSAQMTFKKLFKMMQVDCCHNNNAMRELRLKS